MTDFDDDVPFEDRGADLKASAIALGGGNLARDAASADFQRAFRARVTRWGLRHGFVERDSALGRETEGVAISIPIYAVTAETATVLTETLRARHQLTLVTEPRGGSVSRFFDRLRRDHVKTDDASFDLAFRTTVSAPLGARLLDARTMDALRAVRGWCRLTYTAGAIEVRVESKGLSGAHLLAAEAVAVAAALVHVDDAPYR